MAGPNLRPAAKSQEALLGYLETNFRRLADAIALFTNLEQGTVAVTTSVEIDTGVSEVYNCFAGFAGAPSSGAAFLRCYPVGDSEPSNIIIDVYTSGFAASSTPVDVAWVAIGR